MGCGCKDDGKSINENSESINLMGMVMKLPAAILTTILFVILFPIILIMIWYLAIASIFNRKIDLTKILLNKFNKGGNNNVDEEEFTEENYELVDVDIIK
jgi:hypothetical protein